MFLLSSMPPDYSQQPDEGVSGFQPAFFINNLLEFHQVLVKMTESRHNSCENCHKEQAARYCKQCSMLLCQSCIDTHNKWGNFTSHQILGVEDMAAAATKCVPLKEQPAMECDVHKAEPLKMYCETCDKLVCQFCIYKDHRDHRCDTITDAFPRHQQQILDSLEQVKENLTAVSTAIQDLETKEGFLEQVKAMRREIEITVQHLIQLLQESEKQLMKELDQVTDAYIKKVTARKKEVDITIAQLNGCEDFAEEELRIGSQQEIFAMKGQMVERMRAVCSKVEENNPLRPLEEMSVRFAKRNNIVDLCRSLGSVVRYGRFKTTGNKTTFDLCNASSNSPISSDLVSCKLSPVVDSTVVFSCAVHQDAPCSFEAHYSPPTVGPHQLMVQVGGTDILDTPLTVDVIPRKQREMFHNLSNPAGVAVWRGHLFVAESDTSCVTIFNIAGEQRLGSYGQTGTGPTEFNCPEGMTPMHDGRIVITDSDNHRLQVLTPSGTIQTTIGSDGSQFKRPIDVAVHCNERVFVTEYINHCVQVLNADFSYSHRFGSNGDQPGQFNGPIGIAIDSYGKIYVADSNNNRIQKFNCEGELLAVFANKEGDDRLKDPCGLCFDRNDILYVTERANKTVCMFSSEGQFLGYIGESDGSSFQRPIFIACDETGLVYISGDGKVVSY